MKKDIQNENIFCDGRVIEATPQIRKWLEMNFPNAYIAETDWTNKDIPKD